jgi:hypothetical protein
MTEEEEKIQAALGTVFTCCFCEKIKPTSEQYQFDYGDTAVTCCKDCFTSTAEALFPDSRSFSYSTKKLQNNGGVVQLIWGANKGSGHPCTVTSPGAVPGRSTNFRLWRICNLFELY